MSPQIFEHKKYTEKTDIWSVGAIFYEMLYGRNPFSGCNNLMELKERVKK
jgi:serine/threonine protein kinase